MTHRGIFLMFLKQTEALFINGKTVFINNFIVKNGFIPLKSYRQTFLLHWKEHYYLIKTAPRLKRYVTLRAWLKVSKKLSNDGNHVTCFFTHAQDNVTSFIVFLFLNYERGIHNEMRLVSFVDLEINHFFQPVLFLSTTAKL